jgi:HipA-like protein
MNRILEVYLESRASRVKVGNLFKEGETFIFEYDMKYLNNSSSIYIGPDIPLTKRVHRSEKLFASFVDRIPSRKNPAYEDYCNQFNISKEETDEILLLATIGRKGPSSFIFELDETKAYLNLDYMYFRKELQLSLRDFSAIFQISLSTLQKLEKQSTHGHEALKRIEIYDRFPSVALFEINKNRRLIHAARVKYAEGILKERLKRV